MYQDETCMYTIIK